MKRRNKKDEPPHVVRFKAKSWWCSGCPAKGVSDDSAERHAYATRGRIELWRRAS